VEPYGPQCWKASANYCEGQLDIRPEEHRCGIVNDIIGVFDVLFRDGVRSNYSSNAYRANTVLSASIEYRCKAYTYAAPSVSINITASFFLISIFTLITIGIGRTRITISAITSVN
jgi:hypothetical protein